MGASPQRSTGPHGAHRTNVVSRHPRGPTPSGGPCYSRGVNGSRGVGLGVAAAVIAVLVLMPALIVVLFYTFANVHAIVTGPDFSSDTMNVGAFFAGLALTVATAVVLMAVVVGLIGRSLSPKRRREEEPLDVDLAGVPEP